MSTIAQLAELKRRLNELNLQKARYGISADPHISMEARDLDSVIGLMERIDIHRKNLDHMLKQREHFGANVPTHIVNQIMSERASIVQIRQQCARLGQSVPTHPVDDDEVTQEESVAQPPRPKADTHAILDQIQALLDQLRRTIS